MKTIRMVLAKGHPLQWIVSDDAGRAEVFGCPIEALLRAKSRFHNLADEDMAVLWVSLDGSQGTPLLIRDRGSCSPRARHQLVRAA
jgi:hypothetical protein